MIQSWHDDAVPRRLAFVSDLHLFSSRCNIQRHRWAIEQAVQWADVCVWGGDLFDFRWSRAGNDTATIRQSIAWLEDWCERHPETTFVYLDGNHDAHAAFAKAMRTWSQDNPRFRCGLDALRIGDSLLLHGDVIEGNGSSEKFEAYRAHWRSKSQAGVLSHRAYDAVIAARMHRAVASAAHRNKRTCLRLLHWIHSQPKPLVEGVERVIFGHTHRRLDGLRVDGVRFYNGGATIRHVPFHPVQLEFADT